MVLDSLVSLVAIIVVGHYVWSSRGHFASNGFPRGAALLTLAVVVTMVAFLILQWSLPQPLAATLAGLALQLASLALFWWAILASRAARLRLAFDTEHPHSLVETGPYRFVRHPFYVSYLVFWYGWSLAIWSFWALPFVALITIIYYHAARGEESKFENSPLAPHYTAYRSKTGFFFPRLG
jgi:protein-S-isoprenylcysteine O-methyltransferase Ste14